MKLFSAAQIHLWDAYTIAHEPITSFALMERAAGKCTAHILENNWANRPVKIFCGKGNNGGDGLVIARQLIQNGLEPLVYILEFGAKGTDDFQANLHLLHEVTTDIFFIQEADAFPLIKEGDLVIDALYGSGLNRPLQGLSAALVAHINTYSTATVAIDVPSGMYIEGSCKGNIVVKAWQTLTFQNTKMCFFLAENAEFFGNVTVLDIGLDPQFADTVEASFELITKKLVQSRYKPRNNFAHKGTYGHALLMAGNTGKMGAALLAAKACLRSGAGLVTVNIPENALGIVQTALPEAMCSLRAEQTDWPKYATVGIGPGLGTGSDAIDMVKSILRDFKKPMLVDADALNILSADKQLLALIPPGSVITPHPKEFDRLFGVADNEMERVNKAIDFSKNQQLTVVLKGHHTLVASKGRGWFNTTGNAGMAKGGSGDVLTGIITAFLAQGYMGLDAALLGVYLHGLAGDLALQHQSQESMLATDLIECIGAGFYEIGGPE